MKLTDSNVKLTEQLEEKLHFLAAFDPKVLQDIQEGMKKITSLEDTLQSTMAGKHEHEKNLEEANMEIASLRSIIDGMNRS